MKKSILRIGHVIEVNGSKVIGELEASTDDMHRTYNSRRYLVGQIGSIVKIEVGDRLVFGVVNALRMVETPIEVSKGNVVDLKSNSKWLEIELFGEAIRTGIEEDEFLFDRGVVSYPLPGQEIYIASITELEKIYTKPETSCIHVGKLSQSASLPVYLKVDELLGKHFAVLGTTGSGKSCSVTVLLRAILEDSPNAHMILLDPHNEYVDAFPSAEKLDPTTMDLPYWLLNFEECVSLFVGKTEHAATSQTNILKDCILKAKQNFPDNHKIKEEITVDTPVPYDFEELITLITNSKPEAKSKHEPYDKIINKLNTLRDDKRFSFLIPTSDKTSDTFASIVAKFLRIPVSGKPVSVIDLSGVPSDVVNIVVSLICRIVFDFAVWSPKPVKVPIVLVCEEAHRYAPRSDDALFQMTKHAMSRIAKEGRKYGVGLGLISQRPSELSDSILSQCNTIIALRMSNEQDQNFVKRALPDSVSGLVEVLPTLKSQEGIVVGEGCIVPMRIRFSDLPEKERPKSADVQFSKLWLSDSEDEKFVKGTIDVWRSSKRVDKSAKITGSTVTSVDPAELVPPGSDKIE